jgi:dTDP-4-dehydrorhamnose reductase
MKRVLILGVSGLIGHKLYQTLNQDFEVFATIHKAKENYGNLPIFSSDNVIEKVDVLDFENLEKVILTVNPDVILNCVGITKRKINPEIKEEVIFVNSVFPHKLANWAKKHNKRVIHFSTDCVFDGKIGNYTEESLTTAEDLYGRTKALGEINYNHTLTIRSSFIGQELFDKTEMLDWFLSQENKTINGFKKVFYSGVSTKYMANVVANIIQNFPNLSGLYQLAPENPIAKYDLLCIAKEAFDINVQINSSEDFVHNPTMNSTKLRTALNLKVPSWQEMLNDLALDKNFYTTK